MRSYNETESLKKIQSSLKKIKLEFGKMEKWHREEKRMAQANAAYKWQQKVGVLHAEATEDLLRFMPDALSDGTLIMPRGGGSR